MKTLFEAADWSKKTTFTRDMNITEHIFHTLLLMFMLLNCIHSIWLGLEKGNIYFKFDKFNITEPVMLNYFYDMTLYLF